VTTKRVLPLFDGLMGSPRLGSAPHLEQARKGLGGGYSVDVDASMIGRFVRSAPHEGVVRRVARDRVVTVDDVELSPLRRRMADDVRRFAAMPTGRRARFMAEAGAEAEGLLIEKCRYGALVALDDGRVVALGFSRMLATVAPG